MRRRIEALADQIEELVSEDAHACLVIEPTGDAVGLVAGAIEVLRARGGTDLLLPFFDAFTDGASFERVVLQAVRDFSQGAALAPPSDADPRAGTPVAILSALDHLARELRRHGDVRVALCVCPRSVEHVAPFVDLVVDLARTNASDVVRIVAYDSTRSVRAALGRAAVPTLHASVDVGPAAVRASLAADAADASLPAGARAAASLTLAMQDAAEGRLHDALGALSLLADHHHDRGEIGPRAVCFVLAGSVLARAGELTAARARVQQGLALAIEGSALPVIVTGSMIAGDLAMTAKDPHAAERHFDLAARLYAQAGHAECLATALIARGGALLVLERFAEARDAWLCASESARRAGVIELQRVALSALSRLYESACMPRERAPIEALLETLPKPAHDCGHA